MPTSSTACRLDLASPRRQSIKDNNGLTQVQDDARQSRKPMRRSSSSLEIQRDEAKSRNGERIKKDEKNGDKQIVDKNQNLTPDRRTRPKIQKRRSSTSGSLLIGTDSEKTENSDPNLTPRRNSSLTPGSISPRRGSLASCISQQKQLSPRWMGPGANLTKRRHSSTSAKFLSPKQCSDPIFKFPVKRSQSLEYTDDQFLKGGLIMKEHSSIRSIEFEIEKQNEEKEEIEKQLKKLEDEKLHLEILNAAVGEWIDVLKNIQRLSKGVPLMRSIRKACLDMNAKFINNAGLYGASLLALRRSDLPTVQQISSDMEQLRAMMDDGGLELSLVDGKFLEDAREILGRLKGTIITSLAMFYEA